MTLEKLNTLLTDRLAGEKPFVIYHKPHSDTILAWLSDSMELPGIGDFREPGFVFSPFNPGGRTILFPAKDAEVMRIPFERPDLGSTGQPLDLEMTAREEASKESHMRLVVEAMGEIRSGKAQKIVVSRKEEVSGIHIHPLNLFMRLANRYPGAFSYVFFEPGAGLWAGASPETLVAVEERNFTTMSLAGTRRDEGNHSTEWGQKEMEEQQMVTDLIVEELGSLVDDVGKPQTQRAGHLLHLRTDIRGKLTGKAGLPELIRRLHPTAAICGLPRIAALEFLKRHEGYDREYYTGFLGELNSPEPGRSQLFVNLRCMRLFPEERKARIFVGGGITSSSDPEKEWEETRSKSEILKRVFS